jgi:hypothetical protein
MYSKLVKCDKSQEVEIFSVFSTGDFIFWKEPSFILVKVLGKIKPSICSS